MKDRFPRLLPGVTPGDIERHMSYGPEPDWYCMDCNHADTGSLPEACPECESTEIGEV